MRKFKHIPTGKEYRVDVEGIRIIPIHRTPEVGHFPIWITVNSKDWEEIKEKEWEVLSFKGNLSGSLYHIKNGVLCYPLYKESETKVTIDKALSEKSAYSIYSVKRLSDGEVFTVGDKYDDGDLKNETIREFVISSENGLLVNTNLLKNVSKSKKPLFTTEDGVEIFGGEIVWRAASKDGHIFDNPERVNTAHWDIYLHNYGANVHKHFSTKEKAEEYILLNKPVLSFNDIRNNFPVNEYENKKLTVLVSLNYEKNSKYSSIYLTSISVNMSIWA